jgi:hypothetical protein
MLRAGLYGEPESGTLASVPADTSCSLRDSGNLHRENASSTANIQDDLVLEQMLVLNNGIHV